MNKTQITRDSNLTIHSPMKQLLRYNFSYDYHNETKHIDWGKFNFLQYQSTWGYYPSSYTYKIPKSQSKFTQPEKVIKLLSPYIYGQDNINSLVDAINGKEINTKIEIECQANKLIYFFKELFETDKTSFTTKKELSKWIIKNFRFLNNGKFCEFKQDTIQRTLMRDCKPPKNPIKIV